MKKSAAPETTDPEHSQRLFELLNEVGIIAQLSRTLLESRLEDGMTIHHFGVLNHLFRLGDGKTPLALARAFQVPKTSMSHTLAGLEKRGLIKVTPNPDDGRGKLIFLTAAGHQIRKQAIARVGPDLAAIIPQFGANETRTVLPALRKLRVLLDQSRVS